MKKNKDDLIEFVDSIRDPLRYYASALPDSSELSLLDKDEIVEFLILLEGELYFKWNDDKGDIMHIFNTALGNGTLARFQSSLVEV
jgi:hypothetical protein